MYDTDTIVITTEPLTACSMKKGDHTTIRVKLGTKGWIMGPFLSTESTGVMFKFGEGRYACWFETVNEDEMPLKLVSPPDPFKKPTF